jgi:hypothetical protein
MTLENGYLVSRSGFGASFRLEVLMTSPCSSGSLQFVIYEVDNDIYGLVSVPLISGVIGCCANSAADSQKFLEELCPDAQVKRIWMARNQDLFKRSVTHENLDCFVGDLRGAIEIGRAHV